MSKANRKSSGAPAPKVPSARLSTPSPSLPPRVPVRSSNNRRSVGSRVGISSSRMSSLGSRISTRGGNLGQSLRVSGREFITSVKNKSGTVLAGSVLLHRLNVAGPTNTRLAQFASIYERWRAIKYTYHFVSALPTTCSGTYVMVSDPDPLTTYDDGSVANIPAWRALRGSKMFQAWQNCQTDLPSGQDYTSLWTADIDPLSIDETDRLSSAGQVWFGVVVPPRLTDVPLDSDIGIVELEFDIEFYSPRLTLSATEREYVLKDTAAHFVYGSGFASGLSQYILDQAIQWAKIFADRAVPTVMTTIFKEALSWAGFTAPGALTDDASPAEAGMTRCNIQFRMIACSNDVFYSSITPLFSSVLGSGVTHNCAYSNGLTEADGLNNYSAPDGNDYKYCKMVDFDFATNLNRGFADIKLIFPTSTDYVAHPVVMFFSWTLAGSTSYQEAYETPTIGGRSRHVKRVTSPGWTNFNKASRGELRRHMSAISYPLASGSADDSKEEKRTPLESVSSSSSSGSSTSSSTSSATQARAAPSAAALSPVSESSSAENSPLIEIRTLRAGSSSSSSHKRRP